MVTSARTPAEHERQRGDRDERDVPGRLGEQRLHRVEEAVGHDVLDRPGHAVEGVGDPVGDVVDQVRQPVPPLVHGELGQALVGARQVDRDDRADRPADQQDPTQPRVTAVTAGDLLGALARCGRGAVEHHRHQHDESAGHERVAHVVDPQGRQHRLAEAGPVDERGEGGHRQCREGRLVEPDDDRLAGHRELHLEQPLPVGLAGRVGGLDGGGRDLADAEARDPDQRRQGVDQGGDHGGTRPDAEEQHDRRQVDEGGHGLQQSRTTVMHLVGSLVGADQHRERHPDDDGERHGDARDDQRVEGVPPVAEDPEGEERAEHEQGAPPAGDRQADVRRQGGDAQPADLRHRPRQVGLDEHPLQPVDQVAQRIGDRVGELHERVGVPAGEEAVLPLGQRVVQVGARGAGERQGVVAVGEPPHDDPDGDDGGRRDPAADALVLGRRWRSLLARPDGWRGCRVLGLLGALEVARRQRGAGPLSSVTPLPRPRRRA